VQAAPRSGKGFIINLMEAKIVTQTRWRHAIGIHKAAIRF
jgi:hypothetical protein